MSQLDITSPSNPKIKWARSLHQAKTRRDEDVFIVEGAKEVRYALEAGFDLKTLFIAPEIFGTNEIAGKNADFTISKNCFERIAYRFTSDGVIAVFRKPEPKLADFTLSPNPFILIMEAIEKPGNLGAALRVADGAGADGLIVCDEHTDVWNPNVIRASVGTIFTTQIAVASSKEVYSFLDKNAVTPYAAELTDEATDYTKSDFTKPAAIVLGTEQADVSDFWLQRAQHIMLPMYGKNSSLNVSTAAAVLAYEVVRQRAT